MKVENKLVDELRIEGHNTQQRAVITEVLRNARGPLTVEEIFAEAQQKLPSLGIATVYRTIKKLLEGNSIRSVVLPDGKTRYEAATKEHHHHFRCSNCEMVFNLDVCPVSLPQGTMLPGGFQVESHELTLFGTCSSCRENADAGPDKQVG